MRILFVLDNYPPHFGGAEKVFEQIVTNLSKKGHQIKVVTTSNTSKYIHYKSSNVETFYYPWKMVMDHPIPRRKDIERHIEWADIVHTATYSVAKTTLSISKQYKKKCVISPFEALGSKWRLVEPNLLKALMFKYFEKWVIKSDYDHFHVISDATGRDVQRLGISESKITTAYPGIDYQLWNKDRKVTDLNGYFGLNQNVKVVLYYGRPGKSKGVFLLLEAIKRIRKEVPVDYKFCFILAKEPSGPRNKFLQIVEESKLGGLVIVRDSIPWESVDGNSGIMNYVKAANFVIVPSLTEGFGFCAAETCALGVPLLVSNAGSLPEVVSGKHIFFESNNVEDLSKKIILAIKGEFSILPEKRFEWDRCIKILEEMYKEVLVV